MKKNNAPRKDNKKYKATFLKSHTYMLRGKRATPEGGAAQLPRHYWDSFAVAGIIKCTKAQLDASKKREAKRKGAQGGA